jgi:hypothetical protein
MLPVAMLAGVLVEAGGGLVPALPPCAGALLPCGPVLVAVPGWLEGAFEVPALLLPLFDAAAPVPAAPLGRPVDGSAVPVPVPVPVTTLEGGAELPPVPVLPDDPQAAQYAAAAATTSNRQEFMTAPSGRPYPL